jgi:hypothetical protein
MKILRYAVAALSLVFGLLFGAILCFVIPFAVAEGFVFTKEFAYAIGVYGLGFAASVYGLIRFVKAFRTARPAL